MGSFVLAATTSKSGDSFNPTALILIAAVAVLFYMFMIRPQRRRQQQVQQQQRTVQPGARVRTTAGMYATVVAVDGDDVVLEVAPDVEVRYMKRAIMDVVSPAEEAEDDGAYDEDEPAEAEDAADDDLDDDLGEDEDEDELDDDIDAEAGESAQATAESGHTAKD